MIWAWAAGKKAIIMTGEPLTILGAPPSVIVAEAKNHSARRHPLTRGSDR